MATTPTGSGLFASLRRLAATGLEMAQVRADLVAAELAREKLRIFDGLLWAGLALLFGGLGLVLLIALVLVVFWDQHRVAALGILCAAFIVGAVLSALRARARLDSPDGLLPATRAELARDRAALEGRE